MIFKKIIYIIISSILIFAACQPDVKEQAPEPIPPPPAGAIFPEADTWVSSWGTEIGTNHGTHPIMHIRTINPAATAYYYSVARFNLRNRTIDGNSKGKLYLTATANWSGGIPTVYAFPINNNAWGETSLTYTSSIQTGSADRIPEVSSFNTATGVGSIGRVVLTETPVEGTRIIIPLDSLPPVSHNNKISFVIASSANFHLNHVGSRENPTREFRPYLVIE